MEQQRAVQIRLSADQQEQIRRATGRTAELLVLKVEELESRIAPMAYSPWLSLE